jgi:hypothetical protein
MRCLVIPVDTVFHPSRPLQTQDLSVVEITRLVDGTFNLVTLPGNGWMCAALTRVDAGGPENIVATALAHQARSISVAQYVTGLAVLVGRPDSDGNPTDVADEALEFLRQMGCTVV